MAVVLASQEAAAACRGAWAEGTNYAAGDSVTYNSATYTARVTHTACVGCGWNPVAAPSLWAAGGDCSGGGGGGGGGDGLGAILSEATFNAIFPYRNPFYTYNGLLNAAAKFPQFAGAGDTDTRKREVAAFLANVAHETGFLVHIEEINKQVMCQNWSGDPDCNYCPPGKMYFGRGPLQLSWSGNYCQASKGLGLGVRLLNEPELVAQDASISWGTALWFWMTQTGAQGSTSTPHNCMVNNWGFGCTIRAINGPMECNGGNPAQVQSRVNNYLNFTNSLGVSPGGNTGC
jgi:hypothetical protein